MATIRIFRHYLRLPFLVLGLVEIGAFLVAFYAGVYLRFSDQPAAIDESVGPLLPRGIVFSSVLLVALIAMGLYQARLREGRSGIILREIAGFALGGAGLAFIFYIFPTVFTGRGALALALLLAFLASVVLRLFFYRMVDVDTLKRRVLVLGAGERAASVTRYRRRVDQRGFTIVGFVHVRGERDAVDPGRVIHLAGRLKDFAREQEVEEIVVAIDDRRRSFPMDELLDCRMSGIEVIELLTFYEREFGKVRLDLIHPSWLVFTDGYAQGAFRTYIKRSFDVAAALLLLIPALPIMLLTALAILLEDGWRQPVFYLQTRTGEHGRPFRVIKFRSMVVDAEKEGAAQWATQNDVRVTRVGAFIRKTRIDELPQIINVLKGDMSFVGPRPERPEFNHQLAEAIPYYEERHRVKPGITGWAQLCYPYGASEEDAREKLQYDLYYVKNHSLFLDFVILIQTVEVVLFGKGAR
ncbi:sugar transferase, PEP-CTERM system associated/exopolysaccharide biosynthesis polyprenyl glycosylphosphotransferase [Thiohalospira halophila DSM 15071]|uniref:Sugar transferase, PEP-CTERM system associated/exopolysaccharide biosynthesis polyprenyl glycosylphosphotransferase n=1 Tax=Thiohalospira halophila DSM 15071 TaxID=1123397 RepID=A0A1I1NKF4_9GAMM|nr:sugar transferase, PEP-CTERM system associated/exopolysaccharide biosynthesis polyprenyl glycosylphosphotransferase [Thiohalospira halophila DSM 15071]